MAARALHTAQQPTSSPPSGGTRQCSREQLPIPSKAPAALSPPSQSNCATRWSFGDLMLLIGCGFQGSQQVDSGNTDGSAIRWKLDHLPGAAGKMDAWLAETLTGAMEISGTPDAVLGRSAKAEGSFDPEPLPERGKRLLHFLAQNCHREGGTYWLFREAGNCGECSLFDLTCLFTQDTLKGGAKKPELAKLLCVNSAADVDWLVDKFNPDLSLVARLGGHSQPRTHRGAERFPGRTITYALIQMLEKVAEKTDLARIITKAKVFKLVTEGGKCVG